MSDLNTQLLTDEASRTFSAIKVFCTDGFRHIAVDILQFDFNGIVWIGMIGCKSRDGPRSLQDCSVLLDILDKHSFNQTLMEERCEWITGIEKIRTTCPGARSYNLSLGSRIPERDFVYSRGVVSENLGFQSQVLENLDGSGLNTICSSGGGWYRSVIDMLDLVTPS